MKVLGVDSAMRNCGYQILEVDDSPILNHGKTLSTYDKMKRLDGGTFKQEDASISDITRMYKQANDIRSKIAFYNPHLFVLEDALDVGFNRSTTGVAQCALILEFIHPENFQRPSNLQAVVLLTPVRLQSLAHKERKTSGSEVVKRYKDRTGNNFRLTEHEADAYFLAYHGTRFYLTGVNPVWDKSILDEEETRIFFTAQADVKKRIPGKSGMHKTGAKKSVSLLDQKGSSWWPL